MPSVIQTLKTLALPLLLILSLIGFDRQAPSAAAEKPIRQVLRVDYLLLELQP
ncbi:hypothetical protein [Zestomonas thermotolerans]|uniref:hypothetical protein n=1 Tax=Zestomonas thermotolerans TaxID=157784 RepID=UPI0023F1AAE3|nr:hypothetical protein [Pseudomonas thermotolerans]